MAIDSQSWKKWRKLIAQQAKSEQSVAAFCRERGLCAAQFYGWRKRLEPAAGKEFVEVRVAELDAAIEIQLRGERCVRVRPGFAAEHLPAVLAVLEPES